MLNKIFGKRKLRWNITHTHKRDYGQNVLNVKINGKMKEYGWFKKEYERFKILIFKNILYYPKCSSFLKFLWRFLNLFKKKIFNF